MAFVKNAQGFLPMRFFLGMAESGFFPGMIIYISLWYRKRERTMRITVFFLAVTVAGAVGSVLAYLINKLNGINGRSGWSWIFLLEGLPIIPLGLITYCFLANIPETVRWLSPCEKQILSNILREDAGVADGEPESHNRLSWCQIRHVFVDWRIYLYTIISIGNLGVIRCWTVYFPSFALIMASKEEHAHLLPAPPYIMACICVLIVGFSSSRKNEHGYHLAVSLAISTIGFLLMAYWGEQYKEAMFISIIIACCGTFAAFPILLSWLTINVGGHTKRALAVGFMTGFGKLGGILAPVVTLFITFFHAINSSRKVRSTSRDPHPVPPQPSQYTTSIILNGQPAMYYADTTVYRDRVDEFNGNQIAIIDFKNYRQYVILKERCSWAQIPGKITPLLAFATYDYNGNLTYNHTLCNNWSGCHNYEIPPAPFDYYATVKGNIPVDLNLPTIGVNIHFSNFTFGPPPPGTFDIPNNCTLTEFNQLFHPIFSHFILETSDVEIVC
ncbi:unnamed protein product [Rotaria sp. Silwood1]|nr:unnamed protein product [Rotaria sp. Silwood1]